MQERTEKLNIMGDSMDKLEQQSASWAEDVGKFVSQQKRKAAMGRKYSLLFEISIADHLAVVTSKLGL